MGNVRNPVGPLPSSIYWRRRAVVLLLLLLLIALIIWAVASGGAAPTAGRSAQGPSASRTPEASITPGPTTSQTGITARPGGRDSSGGGSGTSGSGAGSAGSGSGGSSGTGGTGGGIEVPAGSALPDCAFGQVQLRVRTADSSYPPGQDPVFEVSAVNSQGSACQVNFAGTAAVLTVTAVPGGAHIWASDDCPASREAVWREAPAGGTATYRVRWDRTLTAPQCATPSHPGSAQPGTYRVTVSGDGLGTAQASFVLTMS